MKNIIKIFKFISFQNLIWLLLFFIPLFPFFIKIKELTFLKKPDYIGDIQGYYYILLLLLGLLFITNSLHIIFLLYTIFSKKYRIKLIYYVVYLISLLLLLFFLRTRNESLNILNFYT